MQTLIITGGTGFIGSHTVIECLAKLPYNIVSIDNFSKSKPSVVERMQKIAGKEIVNEEVDLCNLEDLKSVFEKLSALSSQPSAYSTSSSLKPRASDIIGVIHFAAFKAVGESVEEPTKYYHNNLTGLSNILECCLEFGVPNFLFSSSCSLYGNVEQLPVTEDTPLNTCESPYALTKKLGEEMLEQLAMHKPIRISALRYFNPVGAHPSALIGEDSPDVPNNLVPVICEAVAKKRPPLTVFGSDYATRDGSCIRDYIHVVDIADAHVKAMQWLVQQKEESLFEIFNLGSGEGSTVLEALQAFEKATGRKVPHTIGERRPGDVAAIYSKPEKAEKILGWKAQLGLEDMMAHAWEFFIRK